MQTTKEEEEDEKGEERGGGYFATQWVVSEPAPPPADKAGSGPGIPSSHCQFSACDRFATKFAKFADTITARRMFFTV